MPSIGSQIVNRQRGAPNAFVAFERLPYLASTGTYYNTQDFSGWHSAYTRLQKPIDIVAHAGLDDFRRLALERSRHFVSAAGLGFVQPRDISASESHSGPARVLSIRARSARYDIECLALNVYFEARGEPFIGKIAVAHVVLNRMRDRRFPASACMVVQQGDHRVRHNCQFSWWCDGKSDRPRHRTAWATSLAVAKEVYWGFAEDPTRGALWYHADTSTRRGTMCLYRHASSVSIFFTTTKLRSRRPISRSSTFTKFRTRPALSRALPPKVCSG